MAEDPRATAIINAENRTKQVLLDAATDVARYQSSVENASRRVARSTDKLRRDNETAFRRIIRVTGDTTEIIEEQVHTISDELVPAYDSMMDAQYRVVDSEKRLSQEGEHTNRVFRDRMDLLEKTARASIPGRVAESGVSDATGAEGAGNLAGALVTTAVAADRANVGVKAYNAAVAAGETKSKAFRIASDKVTFGLRRVGAVFVTVGRSIVTILASASAAMVVARRAGAGLFATLITGVRAFTVALLASPLAPFIAAIIAAVLAIKALIFIFNLFKEEIAAGAKRAFAPWVEWWTTFKQDFLQELAPLIAVAISLFSALGGAILFVVNKMILPVVKFLGEALLGFMRLFNRILLTLVDSVIDILQPILDGIYRVVNGIRVAWAVVSSDSLSLVDKIKLMGKLWVASIFDMAKTTISLFFGLFNAVARIVILGVNQIVFVISNFAIILFNVLEKGIEKVMGVFDAFKRNIVGFFKDPLESVVGLFNSFVNKAREFGQNVVMAMIEGWNKAKSLGGKILDFLGFGDGGGDDVSAGRITQALEAGKKAVTDGVRSYKDAIRTLIERDKVFGSVEEMLAAGIGVDPDKFTGGVEAFRDKLIAGLQVLQERFGVDLESIADQVDVELLTAPDLRAGFKKILDKTKLKLELLGMEKLNENLSKVNSKDIRVEINPLLQFNVTENVDAEQFRAIALPIIDQAFLDGAAKLGQQIYTANVGNV